MSAIFIIRERAMLPTTSGDVRCVVRRSDERCLSPPPCRCEVCRYAAIRQEFDAMPPSASARDDEEKSRAHHYESTTRPPLLLFPSAATQRSATAKDNRKITSAIVAPHRRRRYHIAYFLLRGRRKRVTSMSDKSDAGCYETEARIIMPAS